jgi:hypothetical protein
MTTTNTKSNKVANPILGLNFNVKHVIWNSKRNHSYLTQLKFR